MREMTERLATDPELAAALPGRARGLPAPPGRGWRRCRASTRQRRRHADRVKCLHVAGRARAGGRPGRQPVRRRGARRCSRTGGPAGRASRRGASVTRVAAIDCGTNSIRLLVADVDRTPGPCATSTRRMEIVRLGQGVDRTGRLAAEALERTFAALRGYAAAIAERRRRAVRMVATSATRDAANRDEFVDGVRGAARRRAGGRHRRRGGAAVVRRRDRRSCRRRAVRRRPTWSCDIGGGSTEFVRRRRTACRRRVSVDIGCVRMTERHLHDDPPTPDEVAAATADIDAALAAVDAACRCSHGAHAGRAGRLGDDGRRAGAGADRPTTRSGSTTRGSAADRGARGDARAAGRDPRASARRCRSCTPAGSTSSARARWCSTGFMARGGFEHGRASASTTSSTASPCRMRDRADRAPRALVRPRTGASPRRTLAG